VPERGEVEVADCPECLRLRDEYWTKIQECGRLHAEQRAADAGSRPDLDAALQAADDKRVAARDALLQHRMKCSGQY